MTTEAGLSARNPRIQAAHRLHRAEERRASGRTLLEGPHLLDEARSAGVRIVEVFSLDPAEGTLVSQAGLERLSSTSTPQSPVTVVEIPNRPLHPERSAIVAWEVADPGNLGTMIRTAAAFGLDLLVSPGTADLWSPKVLRAAAGAHFRTGLGPAVLDQYSTVAAVVSGGDDPRSLPSGRLALMVGSEARGLPPSLVEGADHRVSIPMPGGTESLNAAVAAAVMAYEISRRA